MVAGDAAELARQLAHGSSSIANVEQEEKLKQLVEQVAELSAANEALKQGQTGEDTEKAALQAQV